MAQPTGSGARGEKRWSGDTQYAYRRAGDGHGRWMPTGQTRNANKSDHGPWQKKDGGWVDGPGLDGPHDSPVTGGVAPTEDRIQKYGFIDQSNLEKGWDVRSKYQAKPFSVPKPTLGKKNANQVLYRTNNRWVGNVFNDINKRRESLEDDYTKWLPGYRGVRNERQGAPPGEIATSEGDPRAQRYLSDEFKLWGQVSPEELVKNPQAAASKGIGPDAPGVEGRVAELKGDLGEWEKEQAEWQKHQRQQQIAHRWGKNVSLNKALADRFDYGGNFGKGGFGQHRQGASQAVQKSIADFIAGWGGPMNDYRQVAGPAVDVTDYGDAVDLNYRLADRFDYDGDFGQGGFGQFKQRQGSGTQREIDRYVADWRRNAEEAQGVSAPAERDYGDAAALNKALADRFDYDGDFGDGGFGRFRERSSDTVQGRIAKFIREFSR